jgi:hypothetical protein
MLRVIFIEYLLDNGCIKGADIEMNGVLWHFYTHPRTHGFTQMLNSEEICKTEADRHTTKLGIRKMPAGAFDC